MHEHDGAPPVELIHDRRERLVAEPALAVAGVELHAIGAQFIERVGAPDERCVAGLELPALRGTKVSYLSLLIVKNPYRLRGERIKGCLKKTSPVPLPAVDGSGLCAEQETAE